MVNMFSKYDRYISVCSELTFLAIKGQTIPHTYARILKTPVYMSPNVGLSLFTTLW